MNNYINRELSWIDFNERVILEYIRMKGSEAEKAEFLGIAASNLDEFISVRLGSVMKRKEDGTVKKELSGMTAKEEFKEVLGRVKLFKDEQDKFYRKFRKESADYIFPHVKNLPKHGKEFCDKIFERVQPKLTPIAYNQFAPVVHTGDLTMVVKVFDKKTNKSTFSIIPLENIQRIYLFKNNVIFLEDIIKRNIRKMFYGVQISFVGTMRIIRNADVELDHNSSRFIVDRMKEVLKIRELTDPVLLEVSSNTPKDILKEIQKIYKVSDKRVFKTNERLDYRFLFELPKEKKNPYKDDDEYDRRIDMFRSLDESKEIVYHHPFESYRHVIDFINQAADDPDVIAIRQTLYRVSSPDSPIVNALCNASLNGKNVSVMLELKARFDENQNIHLIDKLLDHKCKVIYGVEDLKTHCKFCSVARLKNDELSFYNHIATGNYNDKSAKIYTDISVFTKSKKVGQDLFTIFNNLSGVSKPKDKIKTVLYSPYNIRSTIYSLIDKEISNKKKGKDSGITIKVNSLSDKGVIDRLYKAADEGVKITIICRGICSMYARKNIKIISIIGKYLEHSRIYLFCNNNDPKVFISSADLLTRNLDRRVELLYPIQDELNKIKLMEILDTYTEEWRNTFTMDKKGNYVPSTLSRDVHLYLEKRTREDA